MCNFYSGSIDCRFLSFDYDSEQGRLLLNNAMLILRITDMHNGEGEI